MTDLDDFIETAQRLASEAQEGRRIQEAAKKGHVKSDFYERDPAPGYDGELRKMIAQVVMGTWNEQHRPMKLAEIYDKVKEKVTERMERKEWPAIWGYASKRTVDRRVNECADYRFYPEQGDIPPLLMLRAGTYVANPALFENEVKEEITK